MDGPCYVCGQPGRLVLEPFELEVNGKEVPVIMCKDCEQDSIDGA